MYYALLAIALLVNTTGVRLLPLLEWGILLVHILGFFGILIPMVYLGPKRSIEEVFGAFLQEGGWSSKGLTLMVGATTTMFNFVGVEAATHMGMSNVKLALVETDAL